MKTKDLVKMNKAELLKELANKKLALRDFRFSVSGSNVKNVKTGKSLRKDIARILTFLNKKA